MLKANLFPTSFIRSFLLLLHDNKLVSMGKKERIISFVWQHILLLISLFIMTVGVAVCVRSMLGSSVISTLPYVFETAGKQIHGIPKLTIGQYTYIMNARDSR